MQGTYLKNFHYSPFQIFGFHKLTLVMLFAFRHQLAVKLTLGIIMLMMIYLIKRDHLFPLIQNLGEEGCSTEFEIETARSNGQN